MKLSRKIEEFFKNGMEDIFGTIAILGLMASVPLSILISLIFGIDWAVNIIMGFWLIYLATIFLTIVFGIMFYELYIIFFAWWLED